MFEQSFQHPSENPCAGAAQRPTAMERLKQNLDGVNGMIHALNEMIPQFNIDTPEQTLPLQTSTSADCDSESQIVEEQITLQQAQEKLSSYFQSKNKLAKLLKIANQMPADPTERLNYSIKLLRGNGLLD